MSEDRGINIVHKGLMVDQPKIERPILIVRAGPIMAAEIALISKLKSSHPDIIVIDDLNDQKQMDQIKQFTTSIPYKAPEPILTQVQSGPKMSGKDSRRQRREQERKNKNKK